MAFTASPPPGQPEAAATTEEQYHLGELQIALDASHPAHLVPEIRRGERVLDVGCGAGQTLIAACPYRPPNSPAKLCDCEAYGCPADWGCGIDIDEDALRLGRTWTRLELKHACAEDLPFPNGHFDVIVSRVTLAYTDIPQAVREMRRVLKPGGHIWITLHPFWLVKRQFKKSNWRGKLFNTFVAVNGVFFHLFLKTLRIGRFSESWQTESAMRRVLLKNGFASIASRHTPHYFLITARG